MSWGLIYPITAIGNNNHDSFSKESIDYTFAAFLKYNS